MKIGELARATGVSTRTIRYYERIGLLPEPARADNGYRRYGRPTIDRLGFVRDAQAAGLSLAEIGVILDLKDHGESTCDHVVLLLEDHVRSVDRQIEELQRTRAGLRGMIVRARALDPAECLDPNRCQTIAPPDGHNPAPRQDREEPDMNAQTTLSVPEVHCGHCKTSLEGAVGAVHGVSAVDVSIDDATIDVAFDQEVVGLEEIKGVIEEQGYAVVG